MLTATHLACSRGERSLFSGLDLAVGAGEWLHVTGRNGSGKTTLLRTLVGLCAPEHGRVLWNGVPTSEAPDEFRRALIFLGHQIALKDEFTPLENLRCGTAIDGIAIDDRQALASLDRLGLRGREALPTRFLSAGQRRRVLMAHLLVRPALLWVLDEPFTALDPTGVDLVSGMIKDHLAQGGMAVLTSHQAMPMPAGRVVAL